MRKKTSLTCTRITTGASRIRVAVWFQMKNRVLIIMLALAVVLACSVSAPAVTMDWVKIGDAGNAGEQSRLASHGDTTYYGGVDYEYYIGKYEVTNNQYCEFLNAVDPNGTNTYYLYDPSMSESSYGGIWFDSGAANGSKYSVKTGRGNNPVNFVSLCDTFRFANWMHNGQGSGSTETGAYDMSYDYLAGRRRAARVFLPYDDEWYKAAYYKGGGLDAGYWNYATANDTCPISEVPPGVNNSANYHYAVGGHHISDVGAYVNSGSAYGTFDQNGNLMEWTDTKIYHFPGHIIRGGSFWREAFWLAASSWNFAGYSSERAGLGFRVASIPGPTTYYVDADAAAGGDGSSWADAYNYLQDALAAASSNPDVNEIWVAEGIYKPDQGAGIAPGDRAATFQLRNGITLKGGYAGFGEPDPDVRDTDAYETILSGDLGGNDGPNFANNSENSYHIADSSSTEPNAVLDGFTITGGNADQGYPSPHQRGGGIYNRNGSPTVRNCTFSGNSAGRGGGMYSKTHTEATVSNCTFIGNRADLGGGMHNDNHSMTTVSNCVFSGNRADSGGGMYNMTHSNPTLTDCVFSGSLADDDGGGMYNNNHSRPTLTNCVFSGNLANTNGGGMYSYNYSRPTLTNCTFSGNRAGGEGGGMHNSLWSGLTLTNCIFWGNEAADSPEIYFRGEYNLVLVNYSDVRGSWPGEGNIDADPCFVQPGYCDANDVWVDGDYHLLPGSLCIDAGDNGAVATETDLDGKPRILDGDNDSVPVVDMGAYEFQRRRILYVDDDAPDDPGPRDPAISDPDENGTQEHPFDRIQEAMNVASVGDTVIVLPGDYYENTNFMGKNFSLTSADPGNPAIQQATRIHAESGYAIIASDGDILGLSIFGDSGIRCFDTDYTSYSPTIRNCRIIVERIGIRFTLPYCHDAVHPVIENNIIAASHQCIYMDAQAYAKGGVEGVFRNNIFTSSGEDKTGSGITYRGCKSAPQLVNNIFVNLKYGIEIFYCCKFEQRAARIRYNNLYDNQENYHVAAASCPLDLTCVQGNISEDPLFIDFANGDYHLLPGSPCIDAGDNGAVAAETDLDGKPRILDGDNDGVPVVDMGAYEASPEIEAEVRVLPRVINRCSKMARIMGIVRLPEGITRDQIDSDQPLLLYPANIESVRQRIIQSHNDGAVRTTILAYFDKAELMGAVSDNGRVELQVAGELKLGRSFFGRDAVIIIGRPDCRQRCAEFDFVAGFFRQWLKPSSDLESDLDGNGRVDFRDFSIIADGLRAVRPCDDR